jgi:DNA-binding CsgD family transcriptional regulator
MVRDELEQFIRYNDVYKEMCGELLHSFYFNENTVAAFTRCGTSAGSFFLSRNFTSVFGYSRKLFIEGDLQFLIKHIHPEDLHAFTFFAETATLNATPWKEAKEKAVHECCSRIKHYNGKWIWINQKVIVLSVTPDRHIDIALLLFDDCTAAKQAELNQHTSLIEKSRKKSKLLELLASVTNVETKREKLLMGVDKHPSLTPREKEIMKLVSQGLSSKEVANKLFISKHTVESHRKHILQKLSVRNVAQMVHESVVQSY